MNETTPPVRTRRRRWAYMAAPGYNPPNLKCQEAGGGCTAPSKSFFIGGKALFAEDGSMIGTQQRWKCEHGHEWKFQELSR